MKIASRPVLIIVALVLLMNLLAAPGSINAQVLPKEHSGKYMSFDANSENISDLSITGLNQKEFNPKLDSTLNGLVKNTGSPLPASISVSQSSTGEPAIRVIVETVPGYEEEALAVSGAIGVIETTDHGLLQVTLPVSGLGELVGHPGVRFIRLPYQALMDVTSQGVNLINANQWQTLGYDGSGVKIGIIDAGFSGYASLQSQGELPAAIATHWGASLGGPGTEIHGAACAELIYDMAPGAAYYFANFSNEVEFGNAVDWMISQNVNIISCSMGWPGLGAGDGTGPIDQIVDRAYNAGILWSQSAGNSAQRHWSASFVDANGNGWNDYAPTDEGNTISVAAGTSIRASLTWNDIWGASTNNYELALLDNTPAVIATSANVQNGNGSDPFEFLSYTATYTGTYSFAIAKNGNPAVRNFHLYSYSYNLQYQVIAGSLNVPADSPHVMTVGAVPWGTPTSIEPFSSQGPNTNGVIKPDIAAPDGVSTVTYGTSFSGTSASAPCAAGAAALVKDAFPVYTRDQLKSYLETHSADLGTTGKDNVFGSGRLTLGATPVNLNFLTNPQSVPAGAASGVMTIQARDPAGQPLVLTGATDVNLASTSLNGKFDTSATGLFNGSINKVTIPIGNSSASFFYKDITAGTPTITAAINGIATVTQQETITAGAATQIRVETMANGSGSVVAAQNSTAGVALNMFAVTRDQYSNYIDNAAGTWSLVNRSGGVLNGDLVTAVDGKSAVFTGHLTGSGVARVTVAGLTSTDSGLITVVPAATSMFSVSGFPSPVTAGSMQNFTITARDAFSNTASAYTGTVHFSSSDAQATLPSDYTFVSSDIGTKSFNASLKTAGQQTVAATDTFTAAITGNQTGISVSPSIPSQIWLETDVSGGGNIIVPHDVTAGSPLTMYSISRDQYNNFVANPAGTWSLQFLNGGVVNEDLVVAGDNKSAVFTGHLLGNTSVQFVLASFTPASSGLLTVVPRFNVAGYTSPSVAGSTHGFTVTAEDGAGTTITGYTGTVHFTSTDPIVELPPDYTFVAGDQGMRSFSTAVLKTAGSQSLTATDTVTAAITGSQSNITINPAAKNKLIWGVQPPATATAGATWAEFTVKVADQYGNRTEDNVENITISPSSGTISGTLSRGSVGGQATFNDISRNLIGELTLTAASGLLTAAPASRIVAVNAAAAVEIRVESAANGGGNLIAAQNLTAGNSITVFGVIRDQYGNYIGNPGNAIWSLTSKTGGVADSDLSAATGASVIMTGHQSGTAIINASVTGLTGIGSGMITVSPRNTGGGGGGGGSPPPTPQVNKTLAITGFNSASDLKVDASGYLQAAAQLTLAGGKVVLDIPKNTKLYDAKGKAVEALSGSVLSSSPEPPSGKEIITGYEFGPDGALFYPAITLTLKYDPGSLPSSVIGDKITLALWDGSKWVTVEASTIDTATGIILAKISHFSKYALLADLSPANFKISEFKVLEGQSANGLITVQTVITNSGGSTGKYIANLVLNGLSINKQEITLEAGKSQTVSFVLKELLPGKYAVSISDQTGQFTIQEPPKPTVSPSPTIDALINSNPVATQIVEEKPAAPEPPSKAAFPILWVLIGVGAALLLVTGTILIVRRRKSS